MLLTANSWRVALCAVGPLWKPGTQWNGSRINFQVQLVYCRSLCAWPWSSKEKWPDGESSTRQFAGW